MKRKLKKLCLCFLAVIVLTLCGPNVYADTFYGASDWQVTFTDKLESNFEPSDMASNMSDVLGKLQGGDTAVFSIKLMNTNAKAADWYMLNEVLSSMEDSNSTAKGGAYLYKLTYKGKGNTEKVFFDSVVGGTNTGTVGEGLHGVTDSLKDYFYLDTLATNESGVVTLEVTLEGDSFVNDYQDSLADIKMQFAVELASDNTRNNNRTQVVRTGDETDLLPLYAAMAVSGMVLLVLGIYSMKKDKRKRGG